jgi:hypothetical protein
MKQLFTELVELIREDRSTNAQCITFSDYVECWLVPSARA